MTLHPRWIDDVPEGTSQIARAAFRKGNRYMQMRDELGTLFKDEQFMDLFPRVGQLAETRWRLALVTIMQFAENLTDRQAADAVRGRIDWKYGLSLELTDEGFDFSVLSEFRTRLLRQGAEGRLFEIMLEGFQERELVKARGKQRSDSTHIVTQVRELNRLEFVGETLRAALNELASVVPDWLHAVVSPDWFSRYSRPFSDYRLPTKEAERLALGEQIGRDGMFLLNALYMPSSPTELRQLAQVEFLRRAWVLQFYQEGDDLHWRGSGNLPPGERILISPYDPDARRSHKNQTTWMGYKVHLTESCDADKPHLITHVETTLATEADNPVVETIHAALEQKNCLPQQHMVDSGYVSGAILAASQDRYGIDLLTPPRPDPSWQAQTPAAFDLSRFQIDFARQQVTCPQGHVNHSWLQRIGVRGTPVIQAQFSAQVCQSCSERIHCTSSMRGRSLTFIPEPAFSALQAARQRQQTADFKRAYQQRAGIEGSISQASASLGMRFARYIGMSKVHLQHLMTAAALNLLRVLDWLADKPRSSTRISSFARLAIP